MRKLAILLIAALAVGAVMAAAVFAGDDAEQATNAAMPSAKKTIVETAAGDDRFETLVELVGTAGLAKTLSGDGPFTVFAPTDRAFSKVPEATLKELAGNRKQLRKVLLYHVASGRYRAERLLRAGSVEPLAGPALRVRMRDGVVRVAGAKVVQADVTTSNGVIHAIKRVLIPPQG
jgi:uncharacterized surface protein with fasciclin (FAS1) repeats